MCGEGGVDELTMDRWVDSGTESEETESKSASTQAHSIDILERENTRELWEMESRSREIKAYVLHKGREIMV